HFFEFSLATKPEALFYRPPTPVTAVCTILDIWPPTPDLRPLLSAIVGGSCRREEQPQERQRHGPRDRDQQGEPWPEGFSKRPAYQCPRQAGAAYQEVHAGVGAP